MPRITLAGEDLIAQKQAAQQPLNITRFIFANVPGLNPSDEVDRAAPKPPAGQIVYSAEIPPANKGYVNPSQVVYSLQVGSDIGDWDFNWIGLESAEGVLFAVAYMPLQQKRRNLPPLQIGNNITRNFLVVFDGAQALTGITIDASTWQHDFTVRLAGIDERERQSNRDIFGRACFFGSALQLEKVGSVYQLKAGTAYVEGVRLQSAVAMPVVPPALPTTAWLDVALQRELNDVMASWSVVWGAGKVDYVDSAGVQHYCVAIADLPNSNTITDSRPVETISGPLVKHFAPLNSPTFTGDPKAPTAAATDNDTSIANTAFVRAAMALFGIGVSAIPSGRYITDANTLTTSGDYAVGATWIGSPLEGTNGMNQGSLRHVANFQNSDYAMQEWTSLNGTLRKKTRNKVNGVWTAWQEGWHTGNVSNFIQTLFKDPDAESARATLGANDAANLTQGEVPIARLPLAVRNLGQGTSTQDPNLAVDPVILSNHINTPNPALYWHITTTFWSEIKATAHRGQIAVSYNTASTQVWARNYYGGTWTAWVRCDLTEAAPPGMLGYFPRSTPPAGWLKANGAAISRTTYAALFAEIGTLHGAGDGSTTFNLPDARGEFIRGFDDGRGVDPGRVLGSYQKGTGIAYDDANVVGVANLRATSAVYNNPATFGADPAQLSDYPGTSMAAAGASTSPTHTLGMSRPRNLAYLACIKY